MNIYVNFMYVALALASCGGFFVGRFLLVRKAKRKAINEVRDYYREKYNEQMSELVKRYKHERIALIHRYEGLTADLEVEVAAIRRALDPERTVRTPIVTNEEIVGEVV